MVFPEGIPCMAEHQILEGGMDGEKLAGGFDKGAIRTELLSVSDLPTLLPDIF